MLIWEVSRDGDKTHIQCNIELMMGSIFTALKLLFIVCVIGNQPGLFVPTSIVVTSLPQAPVNMSSIFSDAHFPQGKF